MRGLYSSPVRVYLCLALLAGVGIFSGLKLPISLFPNSSKPKVQVKVAYGSSTADEFFQTYGSTLEEQLRSISAQGAQVEKVEAIYRPGEVKYDLEFRWGVKSNDALRETQTLVNGFSARLPTEMRDTVEVWTWSRNAGFFALSFFSDSRSLDDLHALLEPILVPRLARVEDADHPALFNPNEKEIRLELSPEKMATYQLFPKDIERGLLSAISSYRGGSLRVGENQFSVEMPRSVQGLADFGRILIPAPSGQLIHLSDVAKVDFGRKSNADEVFRTNGTESLLVFSRPKPDANVKRMSEDILAIVNEVMPTLPKDVQYRVLVDPSEFIRASVKNVFHEVGIGAGLAVLILFLFIGSLKNTITAAIEIPLSMVLAFILMRMSGMNVNLISLGGLALSAGMNVDASVVVMENIFRHFEDRKGPMNFNQRLDLVMTAVREVRFSVIASTVASLVVFLPLAFTSDLTYAILGDLAKTVVFSHGFSAIVALVLVPTVRLHLLSKETHAKPHLSPLEKPLRKIESLYARALAAFLTRRAIQWGSAAVLTTAMILLGVLVLPKLPREIIGKPDTDWVMLGINPRGNTLVSQMVSRVEEAEADVIELLGSDIQYLFTQIHGPNSAIIMSRLKDKKKMREVWKKLETKYVNGPYETYWVEPWNPSELPIPDPAELEVSIRGGTREERRDASFAFNIFLKEQNFLPRTWTEPNSSRDERLVVRPDLGNGALNGAAGGRATPRDLADLLRVATQGKKIGTIPIRDRSTDVVLRYPEGFVKDQDQVAGFPVGLGSKIVPLKALGFVGFEPVAPEMRRVDGKDLATVFGRVEQSSGKSESIKTGQGEVWLAQWKATLPAGGIPAGVTFQVEDSQRELHDALKQLGVAVALSILLIFVTMVIQFGDLASAALVLVAIPLGMIGVVCSLFVFKSTLSLNSVLGVILLNGIAVANSILLVDFLKRGVEKGLSPFEAAIEAGQKRLRPILITSLTTILGMMPIALGFGDGGRILQPLGITVTGGLWVSTLLTLFAVPALQVAYLNWRRGPSPKSDWVEKNSPPPGLKGAFILQEPGERQLDSPEARL